MTSASFWKDKDFSGKYKVFSSAQSVPDFNDVQWEGSSRDDMKDDVSSIQTDNNTWVRIYSKANYQGRTALIGPGSNVNLDSLQSEDGSDDMDDTVESCEIYDHKPDINTSAVVDNFIALFGSGAVPGRLNNRYEIELYAQDSQYRVYYPSVTLSGTTVGFSIDLDHIQAEKDDHATITFSMDVYGSFVDQIQVTYTMADASQIPDWAIKIIDGAIDAASDAAKVIADGAEIVLTDGVGVVATIETDKLIDYTAEALTFCVDHLNTVLSAIFLYQDDGGTSYFPAVVSQAIARAVYAYYQELFGDSPSDSGFNSTSFRDSLGADSWDTSKNTRFVEFSQGDDTCRAYDPDGTPFFSHGGRLTSVKVDAVTTVQKDDHLILQVVTAPSGDLFAITASMDIFSRSTPDDYQSPTCGVLTYNSQGQMIQITQDKTISVISYGSLKEAYAALMREALDSSADDYGTDITDQQYGLVDGGSQVIDAILAAT